MTNKPVSQCSQKVANKLFKGAALCPPLAQKAIMSPNLEAEKVKVYQERLSGKGSARKQKRITSQGDEYYSPEKSPNKELLYSTQ